MFLSHLVLDPRSRDVQRDLADCQDLHRTILGAFPHVDGAAARSEFRVLYRVDLSRRAGGVEVLVQSSVAADWTCLRPGYLLCRRGENPRQKNLTQALAAIQTSQRLAFRLRANPTRKIETKSGPSGERRNGRRIELRADADLAKWLERKSDASGFRVLALRTAPELTDVQILAPMKQTGWRDDHGVRRRLTFGGVLFEGRLVVTDADLFRAALENGIGSGKAYGFGLLSIAPDR